MVSMEALRASPSTIMASSSSPSPLSIFSPQKLSSSPRPLVRFPLASKGKDNDPDLRSDSNEMNLAPLPDNRRLSLSPLSKGGFEYLNALCCVCLGAASSRQSFCEPGSPRPQPPCSLESRDAAMSLVLSAATGRGWTTGSGMEGPPESAGDAEASRSKISTFPWSLFTKSPRRRMLVAFTCNICSQRTTRAVNPHAYTEGTVFVQCCGCHAYHKLVDHLNLFQGMKCYIDPSFNYKDPDGGVNFEYRDMDDEEEDGFFSV